MDHLVPPDLTPTLVEARMRVLEVVVLIAAISTVVSLAITLASIAWLCFCEVRQHQRRGHLTHEW